MQKSGGIPKAIALGVKDLKDDEALIIDTRTSERKRIKINQLTDFLSV